MPMSDTERVFGYSQVGTYLGRYAVNSSVSRTLTEDWVN
jgi:hypothetical protein